jgi:hypothetical protein
MWWNKLKKLQTNIVSCFRDLNPLGSYSSMLGSCHVINE